MELPLKNDDLVLKNGRLLCNSRYVPGEAEDYRRHRGAESACYVNSLRPGSFTVMNERVELLAQGPMTVADVSCADCHRVVGWKFVHSGERLPRKHPRWRRPAAGPDGAPAAPAVAAAARPGIWSLLRRGRSSPGPEDESVSDSGSDDEQPPQHHIETAMMFVGLARGTNTPGVLGRRNLNQVKFIIFGMKSIIIWSVLD